MRNTSSFCSSWTSWRKGWTMRTKKLLEEFSASSSDTHSLELDHAYMQGARDCVALLRDLGVI